MTDPVVVVDYDPVWAQRFHDAAGELSAVLAPWLVDVEHIGSTAVPGLAAKPVIDIMVGVKTLAATSEIVTALEGLGYEYVPELEAELPLRRYFRRWEGGRRSNQIHLVERGNVQWWDRHLAFRNWLRAHDEDRDAYAALKRALAGPFRHDRVGYTDAKDDFVRAVEARAAAGRRR